MSKNEDRLQLSVCRYLKIKYPKTLFTAESAGIRLTIGQAIKAKKMRSGRGLPDLIILEPRGKYHGLMLELKTKHSSPILKNGTISKNQHIQEQHKILCSLRDLGYYADFSVGIDQAIDIIDRYMSL